MSARKRKFNSLKPLDTLNSPRARSPRPSASLPPKRYNTFRKDPKIVDHLNNASTKDFLPILHTSTENRRQVELSDNDEGNSGPSDREFEPLESSPLKRHSALKSTSNGLLFQMSNSINDAAAAAATTTATTTILSESDSIVSTKLNLNGQFSCIDSNTFQIYRHKSPCIMTFISDHNHPRFSLYFQQLLIKNSQINLLEDTKLIILDQKNSLMAVILKDSKKINMTLNVNNSSVNINTRVLIWSNTSSNSNKRIKSIKRFLLASYASTINVQILDNKEQILERLNGLAHSTSSSPPPSPPSSNMERAINSTKSAFDSLRLKKPKFSNNDDDHPQTHTRFLSNKPHGLQSLTKRARVTNVASKDHSISIPKSNISPLDFYNSGSANTLQSHTVSQLRRSNRIKDVLQSDSNSNSNTEIDDTTAEFETPEPFKPNLCYKFNDGSSYTITNQDFKCLFNNDWINDSILDFFTKLYIESSIENSIIKREQVYLMSSFFYTKLISNPADYYSNVKKWVNNTDLFSKKYVVIPINISCHWFSCIVTNLDAILDFHQNKDKNEAINLDEISINNPLVNILTFDSLRQTHSREIDPIKEFLISYAFDKYSIQLDKTQIKMKTCPVPQQPNMSDCGVHVILNIKKFFENPMETIDIWKNSKIKSKHFTAKLINKYFNKSERGNARKDLRHTLKLLQLNYIGYLKRENLYDETMKNEEKKSSNTDNDDDDDEEIQIIENINQQSSKENNAQLTSEAPSPEATQSPPPGVNNPTTKTEATNLTRSENVVDQEMEPQSTGEIISDGEGSVPAARETPSVSPIIRHNILQSSSPSMPESASKAEQKEFTSPYFGRPSLKTRAKQFEGISSPIRTGQAQSSIHDVTIPSPRSKRIYPSKKTPTLSPYIQTLSADSADRPSEIYNGNIIISDTEQDLETGLNFQNNDTSNITNKDDSDVNLIVGLLPTTSEKIADNSNQDSNGNNDSLGKILQNVDKELNERLVDIDDMAYNKPTGDLSRASKRRKEPSPQLLLDYENDSSNEEVMVHISERNDNDSNNRSPNSVQDERGETHILLEDDA
ncbi:hypothetical protein SEUBUCD646_0I01400 [Saccharomyces eubayanus]|uniref:Ubiquitin-like protease family profile domain-containing protein n=1 Tax=Saccharomyces eubayanus TaxID=1080349 RepID=A0ABN8VVD2_SACEU|nr:hypothetical protein SEUBUCD650_0I01400 [Saccharomyces eubayanus]CAI2050615.1 hypothetical protein SEUBUCD646_0I01400 [Saccharomyces eubayanus]